MAFLLCVTVLSIIGVGFVSLRNEELFRDRRQRNKHKRNVFSTEKDVTIGVTKVCSEKNCNMFY